MEQKRANTGLRSQYALRLYSWAKKYVGDGTKSISLEDLRRVFGLEPVKDTGGNVIQEAPLPIWANFQQRALDVAIAQVNAKTDLKIKVVSIERSKHRRVVTLTFAIKNAGSAETAPKSMKTRSDASLPKLHLILSKSPSGQLLSK
jgi:plasmid replication initiation protein